MHQPNPIDIAAKASGEPAFREVGVGPWGQTHPGEPRPDDPQSPNYDRRFDTVLLDEGDRRNVLDRYRYWTVSAIKDDLDDHGRHDFEVAVENWTHDFNPWCALPTHSKRNVYISSDRTSGIARAR